MQLHRMTLLDVLGKIARGYCVCLLLLVWILNSEGHTIRRTPPGCYRSLRHCKAKCCGSGKFCDSVVIRGCTWYKCVSAECDVLHDPTNGKVSTSMGTNFESLATYTCNDGYELSHTGKIVCLSSGHWSDAAPTCMSVAEAECDILHDPTNGNVTTSMGTSFESLATYTCNDGYVLSHTGKRVCLSSGEWSDAAPTCLSVGCDPLDPPCAGSISAPNTTVGSIATYSCDLGFYLTGDVTRTCQTNGYWSGSMPCCEKWCSGNSCDRYNGPRRDKTCLQGFRQKFDIYQYKIQTIYISLFYGIDTFEGAQAFCVAQGGNLVKIDDELVQNFLDMVEAGDGNDWWIGLKRVNGSWIWISDNSSLGFQQWATGYPTGSDNCVVTNSGSWRNIPCTYKRSFICAAECFVDV